MSPTTTMFSSARTAGVSLVWKDKAQSIAPAVLTPSSGPLTVDTLALSF
jgi:hypothetical protein